MSDKNIIKLLRIRILGLFGIKMKKISFFFLLKDIIEEAIISECYRKYWNKLKTN